MSGKLSNGWVGLIILAVFSTSLSALAEDYLDLNFKPDGTYAPFKSKTARELMTREEFKAYKVLLKNLECDRAETILNTAFVRAYPQHSRAQKTDERFNTNHRQWTKYARVEYTEYGYCDALLAFQVAEKKLNAKNVPLRIYTRFKLQPEILPYAKRKKVSENQFQLNHRDRLITRIIGIAQGDFVPAILKVAEWVRRGDVFDIGDGKAVEYFLLARARHLGAGDVTLRQPLQELSRSLSDHRRRDVEQKARAKSGLIRGIFDDLEPL